MKSINCLSLLVTLGLLISTGAMAERPAAFENPGDATPSAPADNTASQDNSASDSRPAAYDVSTETETQGDVLAMPQGSDDTRVEPALMKKLDFPRRGMTQDKVQQELGRPIEIIPAVGKPPISRWVYDDRIVYFEYSSVIHVVAR